MIRPPRPISKPPIAEVLRHYYQIDVKQRAGWAKILCPLHVEENPSASVNVAKSRWNCFVCQVSEDSIDVVMREETLGFREAQAWAHDRFGGGSEGVLPAVRGKYGGEIHRSARARRDRGQVHPRLRRFGTDWA
ncbi:CHC2 zinc finger domain-containing protein [Streptomyces californicus]